MSEPTTLAQKIEQYNAGFASYLMASFMADFIAAQALGDRSTDAAHEFAKNMVEKTRRWDAKLLALIESVAGLPKVS